MRKQSKSDWLAFIGGIAITIALAYLVLPYDGPKGVAKELPKIGEAEAETATAVEVTRPSVNVTEIEEENPEEAYEEPAPVVETTPTVIEAPAPVVKVPPVVEDPEVIEETPEPEEPEVIEEETPIIPEEAEAEQEETPAEPAPFWNGVPDGPHLTRSGGVFYYGSQKETYYNLPMQGVISIMESYGYSSADYWVREDGCKMLGDYIMVAANLSVHPRGTTVSTSLGVGLVCDTGGFAYNDPYAIDIAVTW